MIREDVRVNSKGNADQVLKPEKEVEGKILLMLEQMVETEDMEPNRIRTFRGHSDPGHSALSCYPRTNY